MSVGFVLALAWCTQALAASVAGSVWDAYLVTPIQGIHVGVVDASAASGPEVAACVTNAGGQYQVDGLADGTYLVRYSDPLGRYYPQWFDHVDSPDAATAIEASGSVAVTADADLDALVVKARVELEPAQLDDPAMSTPFLGDVVDLSTYADDAIWGDPLPDLNVILQKSADRHTWSDVTIASNDYHDGTYQAELTPVALGDCYYRFTVHDAVDVVATASADVLVRPVMRPTRWGSAQFTSSGSSDATMSFGSDATARATLFDYLGDPAHLPVHIEYSLDGVTWRDENAIVIPPVGEYSATYEAHLRAWAPYYRFVCSGKGYDAGSVSPVLTVRMPWRVGAPRITPSRPRAGKSMNVWGYLQPRAAGRAVQLVVQRRSGGRWRGVTTTKAASGVWAAYETKYSSRLKLRRGSYRVRATARGDGIHFEGSTRWVTFTVR